MTSQKMKTDYWNLFSHFRYIGISIQSYRCIFILVVQLFLILIFRFLINLYLKIFLDINKESLRHFVTILAMFRTTIRIDIIFMDNYWESLKHLALMDKFRASIGIVSNTEIQAIGL